MLDVKGATPIHYAFKFMDKNTIWDNFKIQDNNKFIESAFRSKSDDKKSSFEWAVKSSNNKLVEELIDIFLAKKCGPSIEAVVFAAVRAEDRQIFSHIQSPKIAKNDIEHSKDIERALILAACREENGHMLLKESQLQNVFKPDKLMAPIYKDGKTPLMVAITHGRKQFIEELLVKTFSHSKCLDAETIDLEQTALHLCAESRDKNITRLILEKAKQEKTDLMSMDATGKTSLHICAQKGNIEMCEMLLKIGMEVSPVSGHTRKSPPTRKEMLTIRDNDGCTPASGHTRKSPPTRKEMLTIRDNDGCTPASGHTRKSPPTRKEMLTIRDNDGCTPASGHTRKSPPTRKEMLTIRDNDGFTPFHRAIEKGHCDMVKIMIEAVENDENKTDMAEKFIDHISEGDQTGLHIAASKGERNVSRK